VADLPQLEPFHVHPVAAHLWRTVAEIDGLAATPDHLGRIAAHLDRGRLLRLAAFLHDIGKGHGGDHAEVGGEIVEAFAARTGLGEGDSDLLVGAVRLHLLLAITATRRDLDDPAVIEEVADEVGSLTLLQVLYLLTIADSKATGPTMWNAWKETLLRTLFMRCAKYLESGDSRSGDHGTSREEVMTVADGAAAVAAHIDGMPSDYLRTLSAGDVLWHVDLVASLVGASNLDVRKGEPFDTVVVAGRSRPGFRHLVAAALAANGIDVLEARMFGRADGVLVDSFRVRDDRTGGRVPEDRWSRVRADVEAGLTGELDTGSKLAGRAAAYPVTGLTYDKPTARIADDPATGEAMIVVKCSDRMGRLAEILQVLDECGLEIRLAKLDSREGEVVDTFHVGSDRLPEDRDALERRIAGAISA
jgi:[protein-PII] uridylyltransferase